MQHLEWATFVDIVTSPLRRRDLGGPEHTTLVVSPPTGAAPDAVALDRIAAGVSALPAVVILEGELDTAGPVGVVVDVVATGADLDAIVAGAEARPLAATALVRLLRGDEQRTVADGLAAESAVYSTLQAGPEFGSWRDAHPARDRPPPEQPSVRVDRRGDELTVTLARADVRNALDARMRDELWAAFLVAAADPALRVTWRGAGPDFCSGGHLDEFGTRPDPATGHLIRLSRSLGGLLDDLADRVTVELHGSCLGSGIELPAFTRAVRAAPDTSIGLPELSLGLIPGAGGTVSLPRRIGRQRTAWLALTGHRIDAPTALDWGLVDEVTAPT